MRNKLRQLRQDRGERLEDICWIVEQRTGRKLTPMTLSRIERGRSDSGPETLAAIARALRVNPAWLWSAPGVAENEGPDRAPEGVETADTLPDGESLARSS